MYIDQLLKKVQSVPQPSEAIIHADVKKGIPLYIQRNVVNWWNFSLDKRYNLPKYEHIRGFFANKSCTRSGIILVFVNLCIKHKETD